MDDLQFIAVLDPRVRPFGPADHGFIDFDGYPFFGQGKKIDHALEIDLFRDLTLLAIQNNRDHVYILIPSRRKGY